MKQLGQDRVQVTGVKGLPPPDTTKVGFTAVGGYQAEFHIFLCGLDLEAKAEMCERQIRFAAGDAAKQLSCFKFSLNGYCPENPRNQDVATVDLRVFVQTQNKSLVSKATLDVPGFNRWWYVLFPPPEIYTFAKLEFTVWTMDSKDVQGGRWETIKDNPRESSTMNIM